MFDDLVRSHASATARRLAPICGNLGLDHMIVVTRRVSNNFHWVPRPSNGSGDAKHLQIEITQNPDRDTWTTCLCDSREKRIHPVWTVLFASTDGDETVLPDANTPPIGQFHCPSLRPTAHRSDPSSRMSVTFFPSYSGVTIPVSLHVLPISMIRIIIYNRIHT